MKMIQTVRNLLNELRSNNKELLHLSKKNDDIYSLNIMQNLLINFPYLPLNGGALRPFCLSYILNEILINERKNIIEYGSGLSTILIARLIKVNNLDTRLVTVEHNENWASIVKGYLSAENLTSFVTFIRTDLKEIQTPQGLTKWYDLDIISKSILNKKFDLIIVDGPPANTEEIKYSRYPAFIYPVNNYADECCILLDDANRQGEKEIISYFSQLNKDFKLKIESGTLAVFRSRNDFNPVPVYY